MTAEVRPTATSAGSPEPAVLSALSVEDAKLVTLARGAMARAGSAQGAAVRDDDGRTYAAAAVSLPSLTLSAVQSAVVLAVSSAATGLEAAVAVGGPPAAGGAVLDEPSLAVLRELGTPGVIVADAAGAVAERRLL
jgi:hypothetical protein